MRSVLLVTLLAAFIVNSAQQDTTTNPPDATTDGNTNLTSTTKNDTNGSTPITATTTPTTTPTTTTTAQTSTTPKPLGNLRPVGLPCLQAYWGCTASSPEYLSGNFCAAFRDKMSCFNSTAKNCTADEVDRIQYVDCGPNEFGTSTTVRTLCRAKITECLSLSVKPAEIKITTNFTSFFCSVQPKGCVTTSTNQFVCNEIDYAAALTIAKCTAAHTVVSSALFISLAVLAQRIVYRY